ncbi:hypothetical protein ACP70R_016190 [Stipagrostis hirtigluma subsp. patula]
MSPLCMDSISSFAHTLSGSPSLDSSSSYESESDLAGMMNTSDSSGDLKLTLLETLLWLLSDALLTTETLSWTAGESSSPPLSSSSEKFRFIGHTFGELRRAGVPPAASISQLGGGYRISSRVSCLASAPAVRISPCSCLCRQLGTILSQTSLSRQE